MPRFSSHGLRLLDLFSGIGGFSYAAERLVGGFSTTQFVELNPYCQKVLARHWPDVPIHNDITTYTPTPGSHDIITAGFPCQDLSCAGKQEGLAGARSGLFYEILRVARVIQPQFLVLENVANLVSHTDGTTFQEILYQIAKAGFNAEWAVIPASAVGACHRRNRWWCVAYASGADGGRRPEGAGRRQRGPADADGCRIPEGGGSTEQPANPSSPRLERRWPSGSTANRLSPDWRSYLSEPVLCRGDDGLSGRVDRLKALGNAVVPQAAAIPLARVQILAGRSIRI